jgi:hypothetical protein
VRSRFGIPANVDNTTLPVVQGGPLLEGFHPVVPDNGYHNFLAAFRKRCNYFNASRATPRIISSSIKLIDLVCPTSMPSFEWTEDRFEFWLLKFDPEKQARMRKAVESFETSTIKDYSSKEIFVKTEALLVQHKPNWAPRVIYKGSDVYNALSGPIFCELMMRLDSLFEAMKGPYKFKVAYKKTPTEYVPFLDAAKGEFVESDFSANDMKQCADVMMLELMFMRRLGCPEWFIRLHSKTNHFVVKNRKHGVSATLDNQLPTGATDTTFRNSFWNACILYAFLDTIDAKECHALILGDDMLARVVGLRRYAVRTYENVAKEALMDAKVKRHRALVDCSFLSKLFIPTYGGHFTVPLLGKNLAKFNMRANLNQGLSDAAYFAGKSIGYAYEFRFVPDLRDLFLARFSHEWSLVTDEKHAFRDAQAEISWNAREAGITLRNIKDKLIVPDVVFPDDFHNFCFHRYGLCGFEVVALFSRVVLDLASPDVSGHDVAMLSADFL